MNNWLMSFCIASVAYACSNPVAAEAPQPSTGAHSNGKSSEWQSEKLGKTKTADDGSDRDAPVPPLAHTLDLRLTDLRINVDRLHKKPDWIPTLVLWERTVLAFGGHGLIDHLTRPRRPLPYLGLGNGGPICAIRAIGVAKTLAELGQGCHQQGEEATSPAWHNAISDYWEPAVTLGFTYRF